LGLSKENVFILQREGTVEEVGHYLKDAGAQDGLILDNGASPFCYAWWSCRTEHWTREHPRTDRGGFLFTAPDFRPPASSVLVFILKGPAMTKLPSGSVSYSIV